MNVELVVGIILVILGALGIGANQRKNRWLVQLLGNIGYRVLLMGIGVGFIIYSLI